MRAHISKIPALIVVTMAFVAGACGGGSDQADLASEESPDTTAVDAADSSEGAKTSVVARPTAPVDVFASPADGTEHLMTLPAQTDLGSARSLLVLDERDGWAQVLLPVRPNGSTGWIRLDGVELRSIDTAMVVDLEARTLRFYEAGSLVVETPVAVGADQWPTPRGNYYVVDFLESPDPGGAYGPFAFGLSGYSDTLTEFAGGDGQVGIHGTNDSSSIGQAVSHGCVRVPNDVISQLATMTPLGTPVEVV